jgi:hypothetical protein
MWVALDDKRLSYSQSRTELLGSEQDIWALKTKTVLGDQLKWQFQEACMPFIARSKNIR